GGERRARRLPFARGDRRAGRRDRFAAFEDVDDDFAFFAGGAAERGRGVFGGRRRADDRHGRRFGVDFEAHFGAFAFAVAERAFLGRVGGVGVFAGGERRARHLPFARGDRRAG